MSVVLARTGLLDCQASSGAILSALPSATAGSAYCLATLTDVEPTSSSRNFQAPVAPINGIDGPRTPADELPPAANRIISNSVADRALFLTLGGLFVVRPPRQGQTVSALSAAKPPARCVTRPVWMLAEIHPSSPCSPTVIVIFFLSRLPSFTPLQRPQGFPSAVRHGAAPRRQVAPAERQPLCRPVQRRHQGL